jgi:cell division protein FtsZ
MVIIIRKTTTNMNKEIKEPSNFRHSGGNSSILKMIGDGGGNAVTCMYGEGTLLTENIHTVDFVLCDTDRQALYAGEIPAKVQLGENGSDIGNDPEKAGALAEESEDKIRNMLSDGVNVVFIIAGMGGGTSTGAAPVIARMAKELSILTVAIVSIPFKFEGRHKIPQALHGVREIAKSTDALLVVDNERLLRLSRDLPVCEAEAISVRDAFLKADDTLTMVAGNIAGIVTLPGNPHFANLNVILKKGRSCHHRLCGEDRLARAIDAALSSPQMNDMDFRCGESIIECSEQFFRPVEAK